MLTIKKIFLNFKHNIRKLKQPLIKTNVFKAKDKAYVSDRNYEFFRTEAKVEHNNVPRKSTVQKWIKNKRSGDISNDKNYFSPDSFVCQQVNSLPTESAELTATPTKSQESTSVYSTTLTSPTKLVNENSFRSNSSIGYALSSSSFLQLDSIASGLLIIYY